MYKEEYKQGEMWHSAQGAEISKEIYEGCPQNKVLNEFSH
jgi:hypothetical protein